MQLHSSVVDTQMKFPIFNSQLITTLRMCLNAVGQLAISGNNTTLLTGKVKVDDIILAIIRIEITHGLPLPFFSSIFYRPLTTIRSNWFRSCCLVSELYGSHCIRRKKKRKKEIPTSRRTNGFRTSRGVTLLSALLLLDYIARLEREKKKKKKKCTATSDDPNDSRVSV